MARKRFNPLEEAAKNGLGEVPLDTITQAETVSEEVFDAITPDVLMRHSKKTVDKINLLIQIAKEIVENPNADLTQKLKACTIIQDATHLHHKVVDNAVKLALKKGAKPLEPVEKKTIITEVSLD